VEEPNLPKNLTSYVEWLGRQEKSDGGAGSDPVEFGSVFPRGVFAAGGFEPVRDFEASKGGQFVQSKDKATGLPLWVIDADPQARHGHGNRKQAS
jgi:hypothetical protein